jgi:cation diffusion facilitator family transporter
MRSIAFGLIANFTLAIVKGVAGVFGHSNALIADAVESVSDIFSSLVVMLGLKLSKKPADENHPYGHGKIEPMAASVVSIVLFLAAALIAVKSHREIHQPHQAPEAFTLIILSVVIVVKMYLFRSVKQTGENVGSTAVAADAMHHGADVITSFAAFVGISISLIGGPGFESADSYAALFASFIIAFNAVMLFKPAFFELLDTAPSPELVVSIRKIAREVEGVLGTHKCHVRKVGFDHFVDLDILCDPDLSIRKGHELAHSVGDRIQEKLPIITKVLVHVEPVDDYGRRDKE